VGKHYTLADPNEIRADRRCRPIRGAADPNRLAAQNASTCAPQHVIAMTAPTEHVGGDELVKGRPPVTRCGAVIRSGAVCG